MYSRIRDLREDNDLTQKQMGEILSCSQRIYSNYERGDVDLPTDILIKLSNFYNVSVDYLLSLTNIKERTNLSKEILSPQPIAETGKSNLIANKLLELRKIHNLSQRELASKLQLMGVKKDRNIITRIETGKRYVTDIELKALTITFNVSYDELIG